MITIKKTPLANGENPWLLKWYLYMPLGTLESGINIGVRLLIFEGFSSGYILIKGGTFIDFLFFKNFLKLSNFLFL
jgi:hypothetical protein